MVFDVETNIKKTASVGKCSMPSQQHVSAVSVAVVIIPIGVRKLARKSKYESNAQFDGLIKLTLKYV